MFEDGIKTGLFTDFDVCVKGPVEILCSGGAHVAAGARLFDVSSLTKASAYLLMWKLFSEGKISPNDAFIKFLPGVPNTQDRLLRDFLSYVVQEYGFDHQILRRGGIGPFKRVLLEQGFGQWGRKFAYDNFASAYIGLVLEQLFEQDIEHVLRSELVCDENSFIFHPVYRNKVSPVSVVPTRADEGLRGLVHDPLSFAHQKEAIISAGLFSNASTIAEMFHRILDPIINTPFYNAAAVNQLGGYGIQDYDYGLGFDIPYKSSLQDISVDMPLVFAGWTGCRIFFAKRPRITICVTTNRVFCADTPESRKKFSEFFWEVICQVLRAT
jgi:CubicO group peptidase (beta-lactamase class C family)